MQVLKDEIRLQILKSAEKMFIQHGYNETTMRSIAKEANVSVSNLYLYYENKETLFNAIADPIYNEYMHEFRKMMSHEDGFHEFDNTINHTILKLIESSQGTFQLLFEKSKGSKYEDFKSQLIVKVQQHIASQMRDNVICKSLLAGVFAKNLIEGIFILSSESKDSEITNLCIQQFINFHTEGIRQFLR